jgi:hypothetical protein
LLVLILFYFFSEKSRIKIHVLMNLFISKK